MSPRTATHGPNPITTPKLCPLCNGKIPKEKIQEFESQIITQEAKIRKSLEENFALTLKAEQKTMEEKLNQQKGLFDEFKETLKKQKEEDGERIKQDITNLFQEKIKLQNEDIETMRRKLGEAELEKQETMEKTEEKYKERIDELKQKIEIASSKKEEIEEKFKEDIEQLKEKLHNKDEKLIELRKEHTEQDERTKIEYEEKIRKLENKTPNELGEEGQAEVFDLLNRAFPDDNITETKRGKAGSDIFHRIIYNGEDIGLIIYEVKNVSAWNNDFVEQVKDDKTNHSANYAMLVSNVFPGKEKIISEKNGILIVHPTKIGIVSKEIKNFLIEAHKAKLTGEAIEEKVKILQEYLAGPDYKNAQIDLENLIKEWKYLRMKEKNIHERHWADEEDINNKIYDRTIKIRSQIMTIIEGRMVKIPITIGHEFKKKKLKFT